MQRLIAAPERTVADDYDSPWKEAIEYFFDDFMGFYFPEAHAQIDWAQPASFLEQELRAVVRDADIGKRVVDKLVRVTRLGGSEEWLYLHLEIQGQEQAGFAERMFVYHSRLFDRYRKPIASLALLADDRLGWRPAGYVHEALGCRLSLGFPVAKLLDWSGSEARLEDSRNPFAALTLAHLATRSTRHDPAARYSAKWTLVKRLYQIDLDRQQVTRLFTMIDWMMRLPPVQEQQFRDELMQFEEEMKMRYVNSIERLAREEGIQQGMQQGMQEGIHEGMEQGRRAGKAQVIRRQLQLRFGELPGWVPARIDEASEAQLDAWSDWLLTASSIDAVFRSGDH